MPKRLADAVREVLLKSGATTEERAIMFEDFKVEVLGLCPPKPKEQSLKQLVYVYPPAWLRKSGSRGSYEFWALPANNAEDPPPAQPLALVAPPAAAALPPVAPPATSLGFSNGGKRRCRLPPPGGPPAPSAGGRRPILQQAGRL
jgi:hypothetical protein